MRKLDQRGVAAFEFCVIAFAFITLVVAVFDLGRYAITMQSLRALANAGARSIMMGCLTDAAINKTTPTGCPSDPLTTTQKQNIAPFLFYGGLAPTLSVTVGTSPAVVTASEPGFKMILWRLNIWGTAFDAPSASTSVPF